MEASGITAQRRRGRRFALLSGALSVAVVAGLAPVVRGWIRESGLIHRLESDPEDLAAVEELISLGSARVVPFILRSRD
jgi:hypothetical protein